MKTLYATILLIITAAFAQAQSFAPIGATWHYSEFYHSSGDTGFYKVEVTGDSVINGATYSVLESDWSCLPNGVQFVRESNDSVFLFIDSLNSESMIYDLGASAGDTWSFNVVGGDYTVTVDSVGNYTVNAQTFTSLYVTYDYNSTANGSGSYTSTISSLFGDLGYILNLYDLNMICDDNYPRGLRCYEDSTNGFYHFDGMPECEHYGEFVGINELNDLTFSFYPNPAEDFIQIENIAVGAQMNIVDARGAVVKSFIAESNNMRIAIQNLEAGIYLLQAENYSAQRFVVR